MLFRVQESGTRIFPKKEKEDQIQWHIPVIPATPEMEIRGSQSKFSPGKNVNP